MKRILTIAAAALVFAACQQAQNFHSAESASSAADVVTELMMTRRSVRAYKDEPLSREILDEILTCGINAPNGKNIQAYEVRVLTPEFISAISSAVVNDYPQLAGAHFKNIFANAPCVLCIAYDTTYDMAQVDCGLFGENVVLAAWSRGIGSCCLGGPARMIKESPSAQPFLEQLAFSERYEFLYCIALGYPDESPKAKPRTMDKIKFVD